MLGLSPRVPKFVKRYGNLGGHRSGDQTFAEEVRSARLPGPNTSTRCALRASRACGFAGLTMVKGGLCLAIATSLVIGPAPVGGRRIQGRGGEFSCPTSSMKSTRKYARPAQKLWGATRNYAIAAMALILIAVAAWRGYSGGTPSGPPTGLRVRAAALRQRGQARRSRAAFAQIAAEGTPSYRQLAHALGRRACPDRRQGGGRGL